MPLFEYRHVAPPSSESQTPTAEIATISLLRVAGPRDDRVQAETAAAGAPIGARRVIPEPAVERPRQAPVVALEQAPRVAAGVEQPVRLSGGDDPDPGE